MTDRRANRSASAPAIGANKRYGSDSRNPTPPAFAAPPPFSSSNTRNMSTLKYIPSPASEINWPTRSHRKEGFARTRAPRPFSLTLEYYTGSSVKGGTGTMQRERAGSALGL